MIRRLLREPLLHFAVLGALLFGSHRWLAAPMADQSVIVVTADRIASMQAQFSARHGGRPPTEIELCGLIETYTRDEMLYREGIALGLDRHDPVVRNRVRQKVDLLSTDAFAAEPTEADLQGYLDAPRSQFDLPGRLSFEQVIAERWLASYVQTRRTEKGQKLTASRFRQYLEPFAGHMLVERVNGEDVRAYRLWLERNTNMFQATREGSAAAVRTEWTLSR